MNKKIEKFVSQSFTDEQGERFDIEKFAELIVRECARLVDHVIMEDGTRRSDFICKHFGVKP